jgi:tetratricopeptide (TPR) repeat protein
MTLSQTKGARLGLAVLGAGMLLALTPAAAQTQPGYQESPGDALSRNLRLLAQNPKSVNSLMGAGKAALELGDPQAAITLFARAESVEPQNGRIKMWIGSALVQLQQPRSAFRFFKEAVDLGVPEAELAGERGLAWDITGEPRRAQADYRLALRQGADAEVTRRLALSLAISGEREPALRLLEEQLLVRDRAAERTRALVLALTGDTAGANRAVEATMPGGAGAAIAPFLARLPTLSASERALAVHLGQFPGDGRTRPVETYASNEVRPPVVPTDAGRPDPGQAALGSPPAPTPEPVSTAPRRRPGEQQASAATRPPTTRPLMRERQPGSLIIRERAPASAGAAPARRSSPAPAASGGAPTLERTIKVAGPVDDRPPVTPAPRAEPSADRDATIASQAEQPSAAAEPTPGAQPSVQLADLAPSAVAGNLPDLSGDGTPAQSEEAPPPAAEPAQSSRLADVAALVAALPDPEPAKAAPTAGRQQTASAARNAPAAKAPPAKAAKPAPAKKAVPAAPPEPKRYWVQVAGGADKASLPREYARLKAKAPKLLAARKAWTAPLSTTNRLLVGPFASSKEAQEFVNQLAKLDLSAFAWTSEAGQKIEPLPAK